MLDTLELDNYIKNISDIHILFNHFGRYSTAIRKIDINKHDIVVDASCGQGYGAYNLSLVSSQVFGVDINEDYLRYARKNFQFDRLKFINYSEFYKEFLIVNKIVCLETIEHLEKGCIEDFIQSLIQHLDINGKIILSFPIGENKRSEYNQYHVCEPSIDFIYSILKKYLIKINFEIDTFINSYGYKTDYCFVWGVK